VQISRRLTHIIHSALLVLIDHLLRQHIQLVPATNCVFVVSQQPLLTTIIIKQGPGLKCLQRFGYIIEWWSLKRAIFFSFFLYQNGFLSPSNRKRMQFNAIVKEDYYYATWHFS